MSENTLEIEAPKLSVASWRRMTPGGLRKVRHDYRAYLLSITSLPDRPEIMTKGAADEPVASMMVAAAVRDAIEDDEADLVWAWLALAAVSSDWGDDVAEVADLAVAARLLTLSTEAMPSDRRQGLRLRELALRWADQISDGLATSRIVEHLFGVSKSAYVSVQALAESLKPVKQEPEQPSLNAADIVRAKLGLGAVKTTERKRPGPDGKPTLTICREIALGRGGSEDRALVAAWEALTKPMPLAGGVDPETLGSALECEFPWLSEAIEAVVGDLTLRRQAGAVHAHFRPMLLVGPPGSGKTRFARRLANLMGTGCGEVSAAGSSDNRLLAGTARGWSSASPSYVLHVMRTANSANPVVLVDELDKCQADGRNGDIRATLLSMLEPLSARSWPDECLMSPVDLSQVNWIVAANDATPLKGPLLTRLRVVPAPTPGPEHAETVLASITRDLAEELGVPPSLMPDLPGKVAAALKDAFAKGHSLRRIRAAYEGAIRVGGEIGTVRTVN